MNASGGQRVERDSESREREYRRDRPNALHHRPISFMNITNTIAPYMIALSRRDHSTGQEA